jgi:hypothetical protein
LAREARQIPPHTSLITANPKEPQILKEGSTQKIHYFYNPKDGDYGSSDEISASDEVLFCPSRPLSSVKISALKQKGPTIKAFLKKQGKCSRLLCPHTLPCFKHDPFLLYILSMNFYDIRPGDLGFGASVFGASVTRAELLFSPATAAEGVSRRDLLRCDRIRPGEPCAFSLRRSHPDAARSSSARRTA